MADAAGNAVAITETINTPYGSLVMVPGTGILLNNEMDDFATRPGQPNAFGLIALAGANGVAPDKRPLSSMAPLIVLQDGKLRFVAGSNGGPRIITTTLLSLLNHLEFGMDVSEAVAAPRFHHQWLPDELLLEAGHPADVAEALRARGHKVKLVEDLGGGVEAIAFDPATGLLTGGVDPRRDGAAAGPSSRRPGRSGAGVCGGALTRFFAPQQTPAPERPARRGSCGYAPRHGGGNEAARLEELRAVVRRVWGYAELRPLQAEAMLASLSGRDALVVLPTGGGKSLCYQAPALLRDGPHLVVSPLISLMQDQIAGLVESGVEAAMLSSAQDGREKREVYEKLAGGALKLLFVAPERLVQPGFLAELGGFGLSGLVVDEAHCISHWGHDFRPEYRRVGELRALRPDVPIQAYTATATPQVRRDIAAQLGLGEPLELVGDFDRPNLTYRFLPRGDSVAQALAVIRRHAGRGGHRVLPAPLRRRRARRRRSRAPACAACRTTRASTPRRASATRSASSPRIST